jgi:hypothetical protein
MVLDVDSCRSVAKLHATTSSDGTSRLLLNLTLIAPGLIVMGLPSVERDGGAGRGGRSGRDWIGDVARCVRYIAP